MPEKLKFVSMRGQISNSLQHQNWPCQCVGQCQPSKSVYGDLFIRPMTKGSNVKKVQIFFDEESNFKLHIIRKLKHCQCTGLGQPSQSHNNKAAFI